MSDGHRRRRILSLAWLGVVGVALTGCPTDPPGGTTGGTGTGGTTTGVDETGTGGEPCDIALEGVPGTAPDCPEPGFFPQTLCGDFDARLVVNSTTVVAAAPETQEAEMSSATFQLTSFTATIESTWSTVGTSRHCVIEKRIRVYERVGDLDPVEVEVEPPGGPSADNEDLKSDPDTPDARVWYTDPYVVVSEHGSVYLVALKAPGIDDSGDGADCDDARIATTRDYDNEVQLWVRGSDGGPLRKVATVQDPGGFFFSDISDGFNESNAGGGFLDHPRVAAWTDENEGIDRVVVTWVAGGSPDQFVTLECSHADPVNCEIVAETPVTVSGTEVGNAFANPTFNENGDLYIATRGAPAPNVQQLSFSNGGWSLVTEGRPPDGVGQGFAPTSIDGISIDPTPAIWAERIGDASVPSVYVAWTTAVPRADSNVIDARVLLSAANSGNLGSWIEPVEMRAAGLPLSNEWGPEVRVNGQDAFNFVDVVFQRGPEGNDTVFLGFSGDDPAFSPWLTRFRAHDLTRFGEVSVAAPGQEVFLDDVPEREPGTTRLFAGEYLGLAQDVAARAIVGWPLGQGPGGLGIPQPDLGLSVVDVECAER